MSRTAQALAAVLTVVFLSWCWQIGRIAGAHWRALKNGVAL